MINIKGKPFFAAIFCDEFGNRTSFRTDMSMLANSEEMLSVWKRMMLSFGWMEESINDSIVQESFLIQDEEDGKNETQEKCQNN